MNHPQFRPSFWAPRQFSQPVSNLREPAAAKIYLDIGRKVSKLRYMLLTSGAKLTALRQRIWIAGKQGFNFSSRVR